MGVQGFTSYFKGKSGRGIYLTDEAKKQKLIIGIDGNALMYYLSDKVLSSVGSYINLYDDIKNYFESFLKNGMELIVFMDGFTPIGKFKELEKRYESKLQDIKELVGNLIDPNAKFPFTRFLPPKLLLNEFKAVLKELGIHYHGSFQESDNEMKQWVVDNKGKIFGVISNDSDFLFFNLGETYYFALSDLKVEDNEIYGLGHTSKQTSLALGIEERYLPMVATLIGNDYTKHIRSKFRGSNYQRIDSIVKNIANYSGSSIISIIKDNYHRLPKNDEEICLDSYFYYLPQPTKEPRSEKGYIYDGLFFAYSDHRDFRFVKSQPWFEYFFSIDCGSNYNHLSFMRSPYQQSSVYQLEPTIPLSRSFVFKTAPIRDRMFGLLAYELKTSVHYTELSPDQFTYASVQRTPILSEFGVLDCWNDKITLQRRLQELCFIFTTDKETSKRLSSQFQSKDYQMDDLLLILFLKYLKGCNLIPNANREEPIQDWMIDAFILHHVLISHRVDVDRSNFDSNKQTFEAIQMFDYFQSLMFMATTSLDILAITKIQHRRLLPPHRSLDCVVFQILWREASLKSKQKIVDPINDLFSSRKSVITQDIENHFNQLRQQINGSTLSFDYKSKEQQEEKEVEKEEVEEEEEEEKEKTTTTTTTSNIEIRLENLKLCNN
ncbi:hypothetical protein DFA_08061 [Cavenderia fasciculata]|uniref:Asteroid domain-containing protein n=1 Tax=Cavenderia fasciculata TaxID=261658 RepID=F4Q4X3_CACFS|nr:uncharacterized protein DFA_08061 [Cavenderia fasciculata]EGG17079.1 hypothetical protein DFA_08061 [Cavenderia fasciculata]|eukprot:XP_004355563.1 hypothetical protein DFA_08061 [Cavenderia fasciculata]